MNQVGKSLLTLGFVLLFVSCTRTTEFNPENKAEKKSASDSDNKSSTSNSVQINNNAEIRDGDRVVIAPTPTPTLDVIITKPVVTPAVVKSSGTLDFKAVLFMNMEQGKHATDYGTYAVLKSSSGSLIAAGPLTLDSATSGKNLGGMGYPVTQVKVKLEKLSSDTNASGQGLLSICKVADTNSFACAPGVKDGKQERPVSWVDRSVKYSISGDAVSVDNKAGGISNGPEIPMTVLGGLSFAHPLALAALGAESNLYEDCSSPLVLDINGDGKLNLISLADKNHRVKFDLMGQGEKKHVGWVSSEDGLLALDVNKDGSINSGAELFGEYSREVKQTKNLKVRNFEDGFLALGQYDLNKDGRIDGKDEIYGQLRVWQDRNMNGVSESSELKTLIQANVGSISLVATSTFTGEGYRMEAGNELRFLGSYKTLAGKVRLAADVWFMQELIGVAAVH